MAAIIVSDLGISKDLDREAMTSLRGGLTVRRSDVFGSELNEIVKKYYTKTTQKNHQDVWAKQEINSLFGSAAEGNMLVDQSNTQKA